MKVDNYIKKFQNICKKARINKDDADLAKNYFLNLLKQKLPVIFTCKHFSQLVGYNISFLISICLFPEKFYHHFKIKKQNGKLREISEPYPSLKKIQYWILNNILCHVHVSKYAKAYVPNKGIIDNVRLHKGQRIVIKLDIENFFGSIKQEKVYLIFKKLGYTKSISYLLSSLCCLNNCLPQGAPTSPYLSNLFFMHIDKRIGTYLTKLKFRYSRYSDDITISGDINDKQIAAIITFCSKILEEYGLKLNKTKTKILRQSNCQYITGVIVNKKISAGSKTKKELRKQVYYINKYGYQDHVNYTKLQKQNYLYHLLGRINWVLYLEKDNKEFIKYKKQIIELLREFT